MPHEIKVVEATELGDEQGGKNRIVVRAEDC